MQISEALIAARDNIQLSVNTKGRAAGTKWGKRITGSSWHSAHLWLGATPVPMVPRWGLEQDTQRSSGSQMSLTVVNSRKCKTMQEISFQNQSMKHIILTILLSAICGTTSYCSLIDVCAHPGSFYWVAEMCICQSMHCIFRISVKIEISEISGSLISHDENTESKSPAVPMPIYRSTVYIYIYGNDS